MRRRASPISASHWPAIDRGRTARCVSSESLGNQPLAVYKADGLIITTPLGSTAYNLAGGRSSRPGTEVFTITPICPHSLTLRSVAVSARDGVAVTWAGPVGECDAYLNADGQWKVPLQLGDEIRMSAARTALRLVPAKASVFEVLSAKLGWSRL